MPRNEYEKDLEIDKNDLETAMLQQASLFFYYSALQVDAQEQVDYAKERISVIDAELDAKIRAAPEKYGLEKITEKGVQGAINKHKKHKKAVQAHIDARREAGYLRAAVASLEQRKSMISSLNLRHCKLMFAEPQGYGPQDSDAREMMSKKGKKNG